MSDKCVIGAKLDLKKSFGSVAPLQAIRCWEREGAPRQEGNILQVTKSNNDGSSVKVWCTQRHCNRRCHCSRGVQPPVHTVKTHRQTGNSSHHKNLCVMKH